MSNSSQHERMETLFQQAADLSPAERAAFLDRECRDDVDLRMRLERMFRHHDDGMAGFLDSPALTMMSNPELRAGGELSGTVGRYRIIRVLGEGGMGTVYEAEQDQPRRTVALKVIHRRLATRELLRRFEREAQILGRLQHPGIAHVYDAGRLDDADGRPYLAMEMIRGESLSQFVRERNLSTAQRLDLVARICDAVQHAHEQAVIHRDLKPANILVDTTGQPKILDFGVARFIEHEAQMSTLQTSAGQLLGTVPYMSPEQVAGNVTAIDRQSDVYSIGVILYELLGDRLPYALNNKSLVESARIIQEDEPLSLSSISTRYRGDIETIVHRALEKDRTRRYESAAALAADIRRHLAEQPILARPQTTLYRIRKFARRHRVLVVASFIVFMTLIAGIVATSTYAVGESRQRSRAESLLVTEKEARQSADKARDIAEREAEKSKATVRFLKRILAYADPDKSQVRELTVLEAMDRARSDLATLNDEPEVRAAVEYVIGNAYGSLGEYEKAFEHLRSSLKTRRELYGDAHMDVIDTLCTIAVIHIRRAEYVEAEALAREALQIHERHFPEDGIGLSHTKETLAVALDGREQYDESLKLQREVLDARAKILPADDPLVATSLSNIAYTLVNLGRFDEAESAYRDTMRAHRERHGSDNSFMIAAEHNLASLLQQLGRLDEAETAAREAYETALRLFGPDHPDVANVGVLLADVLIRQERYKDAEGLSFDALKTRLRLFGEAHELVATSQAQYGYILHRLSRYDEAEDVLRKSLAIRRKNLGDSDRFTAYSLYRLVDVLVAAKKFDEAKPLADECYKMHLAIYGPNNQALEKADELVRKIAAAGSESN